MDRKTFFDQVRDILEIAEDISECTDLTQFEEYDSLGILNLMTMLEEMGVETSPADFQEIRTGADLLAVTGDKVGD